MLIHKQGTDVLGQKVDMLYLPRRGLSAARTVQLMVVAHYDLCTTREKMLKF